MVRHRDLWPLVLTAVVVTAAALAGVGGTAHHTGPLSGSIELAPDTADLNRLAATAGWTLSAAWEYGNRLTAPIQPFLEHPTELLLVFELGLLVEHLRLLNRVDDNFADQLDGDLADRPEDSSERHR